MAPESVSATRFIVVYLDVPGADRCSRAQSAERDPGSLTVRTRRASRRSSSRRTRASATTRRRGRCCTSLRSALGSSRASSRWRRATSGERSPGSEAAEDSSARPWWQEPSSIQNTRPGLRLAVLRELTFQNDLGPFVCRPVDADNATVHTDTFQGYGSLGKVGIDHERIVQGKDPARSAEILPWVHHVFGNLKAAVIHEKRRNGSARYV